VIFVGTSAWFAAAVPTDPNHQPADAFLAASEPSSLVTTDYVLDETLTLLMKRHELRRTHELGRRISEERIYRLIWVQPDDVYKAWVSFESYRVKGWSFTDCVSRAVIERLKISQAFAFDEHFRQFGNVLVWP
jgi:uncharacterized protein